MQEWRGIQDLGAENSVSPISSSHYLSSMNGFWHQRQEQRRPPPTHTHPTLPPIPKSSPLPQPLSSLGGPSRPRGGEQRVEEDLVQAGGGVRWEQGRGG